MSDGNSSSEEQEEKIHNKYPCKTCGRELRANALYNHVVKCRKKAGHPLKVGSSGNEGRPDQSPIFLEAQAIMERKKRGEDVPSMAPRSMSAETLMTNNSLLSSPIAARPSSAPVPISNPPNKKQKPNELLTLQIQPQQQQQLQIQPQQPLQIQQQQQQLRQFSLPTPQQIQIQQQTQPRFSKPIPNQTQQQLMLPQPQQMFAQSQQQQQPQQQQQQQTFQFPSGEQQFNYMPGSLPPPQPQQQQQQQQQPQIPTQQQLQQYALNGHYPSHTTAPIIPKLEALTQMQQQQQQQQQVQPQAPPTLPLPQFQQSTSQLSTQSQNQIKADSSTFGNLGLGGMLSGTFTLSNSNLYQSYSGTNGLALSPLGDILGSNNNGSRVAASPITSQMNAQMINAQMGWNDGWSNGQSSLDNLADQANIRRTNTAQQ